MMVKDMADPACGPLCPDMGSKSWNEARIWPQIVRRRDTLGFSEPTDSVEVLVLMWLGCHMKKISNLEAVTLQVFVAASTGCGGEKSL